MFHYCFFSSSISYCFTQDIKFGSLVYSIFLSIFTCDNRFWSKLLDVYFPKGSWVLRQEYSSALYCMMKTESNTQRYQVMLALKVLMKKKKKS